MKNDWKSLKSFFCLFRAQWIPYVIVTLLVGSRNFIITYIYAMVSSKAVETASGGIPIAAAVADIAVWVVCFAVADAAAIFFQTSVIHKISMTLRQKMFSHVLYAPLLDVDRFGRREELLSRMNFDMNNATGLLSYGLVMPVMYCISGVGATLIVFRKSWKLCAVIYMLGLAVFLIQVYFSRLSRKYMAEIQKEQSAIVSISMQSFLNAVGIRMAALTDYAGRIHRAGVKRYGKAFSEKGVVEGTFGLFQGMLRMVCFAGVFCYGLFSGMELAEVVLISQLTPSIATMILSLSACIANLQKSMAGIDRILEVFRLSPEEDEGEEFTVRQKEKGLETRGLACRYGDHEVRLADIGVFGEDGNMIALRGPSGCGKTSLLRLLLKLYPCSGGELRFFGQDIEKCSRSSVRKSVAYVPQENIVFPGTLRENILLGNTRSVVTDEEIEEVLKQVGAEEWVGRTGLDSVLKEGGENLSGGQRQMLAIARALLYKKPVILLDESFAALDEAHIRKIMSLLCEMQGDRYVILVTHDQRIAERCGAQVNVQREA